MKLLHFSRIDVFEEDFFPLRRMDLPQGAIPGTKQTPKPGLASDPRTLSTSTNMCVLVLQPTFGTGSLIWLT